ncbi:MAG: P-loop NTPase [Candidatus Aenigmarchaeota archaeon]|nr:P-loop NTPase [Candidatus Aenigmarchaeota archaeon]
MAELPVQQVRSPMIEAWKQKKRINDNLANVKFKIAVLSGKGGVGKTTVAVNLAAALVKHGKSVGILDADIDCPNVNKVLGISELFRAVHDKILPIEKYGMRIVSMASVQQGNDVLIWRGPMLTHAILQFLEMVEWGNLDYLIIDLPPGTSDAPLTVMQSSSLDGAIIVTTPQPVANAKKAAKMAKQLNVKVLGIVENMAGDVFGRGGGSEAAKELGVPLLTTIELRKEVRDYSDNGIPPAIKDSKTLENFEEIIAKMKL